MRPTMGQIKTNVGPSFDYLNSVICLKYMSTYPPTSFICNLFCLPRFQTQTLQSVQTWHCKHQTWNKQATTDRTRLRCHYKKMLCTSCTVSPLSTVMWNSVDIGQRIIYSWICQNCTSQHLAIPPASSPPRLLYKQGAVVSPVSLQTLATLKMQKYSLTYLFCIYISTYNQHY